MEISKFLKISFLIDGLIAVVYGLFLLLLPEYHHTLTGFPLEEFADRFAGSLMIGYGVGNLLAYRAKLWENVELVVIMNLAFLILGLFAGIYCIAMEILPLTAILQMGLLVFLMILFLYSYYEAKMKK